MSGGIDDGYSEGHKSKDSGFVIAESKEVVMIGDGMRAGNAAGHAQFMAMALGMGAVNYINPRRRDTIAKYIGSSRKKGKMCLLPGCDTTTYHNGGYCCADHCKEHRRK